MISTSFYLLNPKAQSHTQLYVSISNKEDRLRFSTGKEFMTKYCNLRVRKGGKELVKKNSPFNLEYNRTLIDIKEVLVLIEMRLTKEKGNYTLKEIRDEYWLQIGKIAPEVPITFWEAFEQYKSLGQWSEGFYGIQNALKRHLEAYEAVNKYSLDLGTFDDETWHSIIEYFIQEGLTNSTTNKYLKSLKQFLRFAGKKELFKDKDNLADYRKLSEVEPLKIALREAELEALIKLDLSSDEKLDRVRDLFVLGILTGQRFSDIPKALDIKHLDGDFIRITQQKTGQVVSIPRHTSLDRHLEALSNKYPAGFPTITNQKFNVYIKDVCKLAGFDEIHQWTVIVGKKKELRSDFRYNLVASHTARRTFCTLALSKKIDAGLIMKVSGHKTHEQFRQYVKTTDIDLLAAFESFA